MEKKSILWLDNDPSQVRHNIEALEHSGYHVDVVTRVTEAESMIDARYYDLLILDVMVPTWDVEEERRYPPHETEFGRQTGLVFYRLNKDRLRQAGTRVLVVTIRGEIREAFEKEGLPREWFSTKFAVWEPSDCVMKVEDVLAGSP